MKNIIVLIVFLLAFNLGYGQTTLAAGEIAITGFNADDPDQFAFVLLTDILNTTEIKFTDNGWFAVGGFRDNEGTVTWVADTDYACGTEIIIEDAGLNTYSATFGSASETDAGFSLSASGDQILAYQGADATPTFIYAINFDSAGWSDAINANTSALPTGLTDGTNAVNLGEADNAIYNCTFNNNESLILAGISNTVYWTTTNGTGNQSLTLGSCIYTCAVACTGATVTWNGVWSATPDLTTPVIIAANYNTANGGAEISFNACSLTIDAGFSLRIDNGDYIEIQNDIVADGDITVETQGAVVQIDDSGTVTGAGTITVIKTTAPSNAWYEYTYWSSPVFGETIGTALSDADPDRRFWFDASNFQDTTMETGNDNTTDAGQDDIDDNGDDWQLAAGTDTMTTGVGYAATQSEFSWSIAPGTSNKTFDYTFNGPFNNGVITVPVVRNDVETADTNWNFIGNSYPSAIDIDAFFNTNVFTLNASGLLDGTVYLWSQNTPPDPNTNGNEGQNFAQSDYAIINGIGQTPGGDGITPNRFIPSGQGFFVSFSDAQTVNTGNVIFNNSMRVTGNNDQFFKTSNSNLDNKLWVNLTSDNGVFNQILVGYVNGATNSYDGTYYDAPRNLSTGASAILYTIIEGNNKKFAIQGKAENSLTEDEVIKVGFKTTIEVATLYKFSIAQFEGDFFSNNTVYLKDNLLNVLHDLSLNDYTFTSEVGEFNNRFEIVFNENALSLGEHTINSDSLSIIELYNGNVQFKLSSPLELRSIEIIDLLGRTLYRLEADGNSKTYNLSNLSQATYIAKVELSNGVVITKKAVKRN
ncbi:T9SS type A sorting domain-containing protein [Olleya sp. AH-315-K02]|nr:T9SS type A sorting domain-containing protein [Olleya sp. AH-315-K02]